MNRAKYSKAEQDPILDTLIDFHARKNIVIILEQIFVIRQKACSRKKKVQKFENPLDTLLSNISHWQVPRDFFMNVTIVSDGKKKGSLLATRKSLVHGFDERELKILFQNYHESRNFFLEPTSVEDFFHRSSKVGGSYGNCKQERCLVVPMNGIPLELKERFEQLIKMIDVDLELNENLANNLKQHYDPKINIQHSHDSQSGASQSRFHNDSGFLTQNIDFKFL